MDWLEGKFAKVPDRFNHEGFDYRNTRRGIPQYIDHLHDPRNTYNRPRSKYIPDPAKIRTERSRAGSSTGHELEVVTPAYPRASLRARSVTEQLPSQWTGFAFTQDPVPLRRLVVPPRPVARDRPSTYGVHRPSSMENLAGRSSFAPDRGLSSKRFFRETFDNQRTSLTLLLALQRDALP